MQIADIDSKRNVINIRHAKGDKDRIAPLSEKILSLLRKYFSIQTEETVIRRPNSRNTNTLHATLKKTLLCNAFI